MKYLKKKETAKLPVILIGIGFAAVLVFLGWLLLKDPGTPQGPTGKEVNAPSESETTQPTGQTDPTGYTTEATLPAVELPYSLEGGRLTVDSVLQYTGMNPDRQDEWAEDVAAIQLTNASGKHLVYAAITITTMDGITASFTAFDIPAGRSAMVVCPDNIVIESDPECVQITCAAEFLNEAPLAADKLLVSVNGTEITVENISGEDLSHITIYCHSMLDQSCYGGTVRPYEIDSLPAGETTTVSAWDCILGLVEVVRIEIGSE